MHARVRLQERKQAWGTKQFQQYIGADVTSLLSVPVWIMEPFTILQKAAEIMEYTDLLDLANKEQDPYDRQARCMSACLHMHAASAARLCMCAHTAHMWNMCPHPHGGEHAPPPPLPAWPHHADSMPACHACMPRLHTVAC